MISILRRLFSCLSSSFDKDSDKVCLAKSSSSDHQLNNIEIGFLKLLEGKAANDSSVLGWWCAYNNIDGFKVISKLRKNDYLTLSDYKFNIRKAKIPTLKAFLKMHGLPVKGKKDDLVNRIIENISETDCSSYFNQSYWAFTPKAITLMNEEEIKAEKEHNRNVDLIRRGSYDELKRKMYPNKNEHWGTEDTFYETIDFLMKHGFEEFDLSEDIRRNLSAFIALRAVNYSSRGYSTCIKYITQYLGSLNMELGSLKLPASLEKYMLENEIESKADIFETYIQFIINRARSTAELINYKRLGIKKIKIDSLACPICKQSKSDKVYNINNAPVLPLCLQCQCDYRMVMKNR